MRDKLAYAAGDLGCNMSFALKSTVQTFWLVYMTMETGLLSLLLLLVQIWDAVNDPLIGSMIDRDRKVYKMGKFKTYILIGACGLLVGGAAVFLPFPNAHVIVKAMLFVVGYIVWDAFYTIANVPYGSMLSLITTDNAERAQLSTWRSIGSMIGNMLPVPFILLFIKKVIAWMQGSKIKFFNRIGTWLTKKAEKNREKIEKYSFWGVCLFVAVPLPITGAWTGSLASAVMGMNFWKALLSCLLGVMISGAIMTLASYGVVAAFQIFA